MLFSSVVRTLLLAVLAGVAILASGPAKPEPLKISVSNKIDPNDLDAQLVKRIQCIRDTIYTEARGEEPYAQAMVGWVVVSRWRERRSEWGSTPCEVAYRLDVRKGKLVSQFSGNIHHPVQVREDDPELMEIARVAVRVLLGYFEPLPEHRCARAYQRKEHADAKRQGWFETLTYIGGIGKHAFYCLPTSVHTAKK